METEAPESNEVLSSGTLQIQQEVRLVLLINTIFYGIQRDLSFTLSLFTWLGLVWDLLHLL